MRRLKQLIPDDEGADRYLPWVLAIMMFTVHLAMAAGLSLNATASAWTRQMSGTLTVEVPPGERAEAEAAAVAEALRALPEVHAVRILGRAEIGALLAPWLGDESGAVELPLPVLLDVRLAADAAAAVGGIERAAHAAAPGARVDDHARGLQRLLHLVDAARWLALSIVALAAAALCLIVIFSTRAALAAHGDVIELLHLMGARDRTIAARFQSHALWLGFRGGMIGVSLSAAAFGLLYWQFADVELPVLAAPELNARQILLLALLPLPAAALAAVTARFTVLRTLARMP